MMQMEELGIIQAFPESGDTRKENCVLAASEQTEVSPGGDPGAAAKTESLDWENKTLSSSCQLRITLCFAVPVH